MGLAKLTFNLSLLVFEADLIVEGARVGGCVLFGIEEQLLDQIIVGVCALLVATTSLDIGSTLLDNNPMTCCCS